MQYADAESTIAQVKFNSIQLLKGFSYFPKGFYRPKLRVDPQEESRLADILISDAGMTNTMLPGLDQIVVHMFQEEGSSEITLGRQALKGRVVSKHVPLVVECPCGGREVQIFKLELVDGYMKFMRVEGDGINAGYWQRILRWEVAGGLNGSTWTTFGRGWTHANLTSRSERTGTTNHY
ncbi:hypothetical protein R1flu_013419 [Riccia fluitans]|uniref:Uncharacterized protein n=1 Tax=Riccia fluitans TaxID=41844 RepID=A0ABD1YDH8_9MARC